MTADLAFAWGLAELSYFYTTSAADAQLEASNLAHGYLVRTTNSADDALVLVVKEPGQPALARYLFRRTKPNEWRTVHGNVCVTGSFADLLRALIGSTRAVPLVDPHRVQQQHVNRSLQEQTRQALQADSAYDDV